jgi:hypothetical protein
MPVTQTHVCSLNQAPCICTLPTILAAATVHRQSSADIPNANDAHTTFITNAPSEMECQSSPR